MTSNDLFIEGLSQLKTAKIDDYLFDCECLFEKFTGINKVGRITNPDLEVDASISIAFLSAISRRIKGEPLQYILGEWEFMGLNFIVGEGVLIPRPETEMIVEIANEYLKNKENAVVYDLCAGSGAIGLSVAKFNPKSHVYLFEKYDQAFFYLEKNAKELNLDNVTIVKTDICNFDNHELVKADLLLSNPPYIKDDEVKTLQLEVGYEPDTALKGGIDGLDFYRVIFDKWYKKVNNGGLIALECGDGQSADICNIFYKKANKTSVLYDFNDIDRIVKINV